MSPGSERNKLPSPIELVYELHRFLDSQMQALKIRDRLPAEPSLDLLGQHKT